MAKVIAVNISKKKGEQKHPIEKGYFAVEWGLKEDAHAGKWHRQVSLLGNESIHKMEEMGLGKLATGSFAENLTTEGITLCELPVGTRLKIGATLMEVTQIGKECHAGCEIRQKTGDCIMPREGIFTRVLTAGWVQAGDKIEIVV